MKVNKGLDLIERTLWTFAQAAVGSLIASLAVSGEIRWRIVGSTALVAGLIAAGKVFVAQNVGSSGLGDALPGGSVIEQP